MLAQAKETDLVPPDAPKCPIPKNHLTDAQLAAIEMLVLGKPLGDINGELKIDRKTLYRWRQDAAFREKLGERRSNFWDGAGDRLKDLIEPSLEVMAEHLADRYDRA